MLGYAKEEKNKQKRKKWIRYERKHSRAGILTGFITRKWIIAYLDDASRLITGYRVFDNTTLKCHKCAKGSYIIMATFNATYLSFPFKSFFNSNV